jgi:hypothetical protein
MQKRIKFLLKSAPDKGFRAGLRKFDDVKIWNLRLYGKVGVKDGSFHLKSRV